jgi:hypothetical protein
MEAPRRPGSGRYWEFAADTLRSAYQEDRVDLGKSGDAIPRIKTYESDVGDSVVKNQISWWPAKTKDGKATFAGFTQDATKHLKRLRELGLVDDIVTTAKPEHLLARLVDIFTDVDDLVVELASDAGDAAAVATKKGRRFLKTSGMSVRDRHLLDACVLPRLRAVVDGRDKDLDAEGRGEIRLGPDSYLPYDGGGSFVVTEVEDWLLAREPREELPRLNRAGRNREEIRDALLSVEGYFFSEAEGIDGLSADGRRAAVVVPPDEFLTPEEAARLVSSLSPQHQDLAIYYFKASEDFDPSVAAETVTFRRVPSEILL